MKGFWAPSRRCWICFPCQKSSSQQRVSKAARSWTLRATHFRKLTVPAQQEPRKQARTIKLLIRLKEVQLFEHGAHLATAVLLEEALRQRWHRRKVKGRLVLYPLRHAVWAMAMAVLVQGGVPPRPPPEKCGFGAVRKIMNLNLLPKRSGRKCDKHAARATQVSGIFSKSPDATKRRTWRG